MTRRENIMGNTNVDKNIEKQSKTSYYDEFKIPKNIRQIGNVSNLSKVIYVEDYVMSYIKQLTTGAQNENKLAILLGYYTGTDLETNIFIKGAIKFEDDNLSEKDIFADDTWTQIYENIKRNFSDVEILGWAVVGPHVFWDSKEKLKALHMANFPGSNKVLLKYDSMEKEESFFVLDHNQLLIQKGYYIYYEKNEEMQNYMINNKEEEVLKERYDDIATQKIRHVIEEKKEKKEKKEEKSAIRLTYAVGTLMTVIVLLIASTMLRNYHQMKNLESALNTLTKNLETKEGSKDVLEVNSNDTNAKDKEKHTENKETNKVTKEEDPINVEEVPGNVKENQETKPTKETEEPTEPPTEPSTEKPTKEKVEETTSTQESVQYYEVRNGDSLVSISRKFFNTAAPAKIQEIIDANGIENQDKIFPGQKLIIP